MAKSKVTSKDTPRQEPIKHFKYGVVSWDVFREFWEYQDEFAQKVRFILQNTDFDDWGLTIAFDLIRMAQKDADECWKKALIEANEAGGNDIYTISMNETLKLKGRKATESPETAT
jgi:hypothetical protein